MHACVRVRWQKGDKEGGVCSSEKKEGNIKKKEREKVPGGYLLWILDDDSEAKTDQTVLFPPSHESNILHVSARLVSPFFFPREVQGDVVTSLMLVPAVLRFSSSFPISFHFLLASLAAPGALPAVLRQPAFSEELQPNYEFVLWMMARL